MCCSTRRHRVPIGSLASRTFRRPHEKEDWIERRGPEKDPVQTQREPLLLGPGEMAQHGARTRTWITTSLESSTLYSSHQMRFDCGGGSKEFVYFRGRQACGRPTGRSRWARQAKRWEIARGASSSPDPSRRGRGAPPSAGRQPPPTWRAPYIYLLWLFQKGIGGASRGTEGAQGTWS